MTAKSPGADGIRHLDQRQFEPVDWDYVRSRRRRHDSGGDRHVRPLLVETGLALLHERGPAGLSIAECARRARVSAGAPYTWFADAADFRRAVTAEFVRQLRGELCSDGDDPHDAGGELARAIETLVRALAQAGLGVAALLEGGDDMSAAELAWERQQLVEQLAATVHRAASCGCTGPPIGCTAGSTGVTGVMAIAAGYAGFVGAPLAPPFHDLVAAAVRACRLVVTSSRAGAAD